MASKSFLPTGFKEDLQKSATKHIKRSQLANEAPTPLPPINEIDVNNFKQHLKDSDRILALFGAGLSAPSGLSTFRGSQDIFRGYDPPMLSTLQKFKDDPILMWWYHAYRRKKMMQALPNAAHYALANLGIVKPGFLAVTQNIDNLSERAGHTVEHLQHLHGRLNEFKCSSEACNYIDLNNTAEPLVPALAIPDYDIRDETIPLPSIQIEDLPHCPLCASLLRPNVRWFGENLLDEDLDRVNKFIGDGPVDLLLVVGTCAAVYPAAQYVQQARQSGARVAYVDIAPRSEQDVPLKEGNWYFQGDVVDVIPRLLADVLVDR